jgi:hypothetical protein
MSRRNFILIIIIILIVLLIVLGLWHFGRKAPPGEGEDTNFLFRFNPFRTTAPAPQIEPPPVDFTGPTPLPGVEGERPRLFRISSMPIAGYTVFQKERYVGLEPPASPAEEGEEAAPAKPSAPETEFVSALRYAARATGNIFQTFADKVDERKFTDTVIPRIYEAYFGNKEEAVVMRYLRADERTIETFSGTLPKDPLGGDLSEMSEVKGSFLPQNITELAVSPDGQKIFFLLRAGEITTGVTAGILGGGRVQVFDSAFNEWLTSWPAGRTIILGTKPSGLVPGDVFLLDPETKALRRVLGGVAGVTALGSPDGKLLIYGNENLTLSVFELSTGSAVALGARTLPEKCVWSKNAVHLYCAVPKFVPAALYPDDWYRGEVSLDDELWKINVETGAGTILSNPASILGFETDGIKLSMDENERYLFFVNKKDSFLFGLQLE